MGIYLYRDTFSIEKKKQKNRTPFRSHKKEMSELLNTFTDPTTVINHQIIFPLLSSHRFPSCLSRVGLFTKFPNTESFLE